MIFLVYYYDRYIGVVGNISRDMRTRESLCGFCKQFRKSDEIVFVTNTVITAKDQYRTLGQYICSDNEKCNASILNTDNLNAFITYGEDKQKRRIK